MCQVINNKRVVLDFCQLRTHPSPKLVKKFVTDLGVKTDTLLALQYNNRRNAAVLEFAESSVAATYINKPLQYQESKIPVYWDSNTVEVYVHDLPLGTNNADIVEVMGKYGEILAINNECWRNYFPGLPNGVRKLKMVITQPVPKSITVGDHIATVIYKGQNTSNKLNAEKPEKSNNKNDSKSKNATQPKQSENNHKDNSNSIKSYEPSNNKNTDTLSSSNSSNNNNISKNNNNEEKTTNTTTQHTDDEGFEIVQSKSQRKMLKRQHSLEAPEQQKQQQQEERDIYGEVQKKERYYWAKWRKTRKEISEETDPEKINQLKIILEEADQKHEKYFTMLSKMKSEELID